MMLLSGEQPGVLHCYSDGVRGCRPCCLHIWWPGRLPETGTRWQAGWLRYPFGSGSQRSQGMSASTRGS